MKADKNTALLFAALFIAFSIAVLFLYEAKADTGGSLIEEQKLSGGNNNDGPLQPDVSGVLVRLGEGIADIRTVQTDFVQEKDLSIFQKKIVLRGRIYLQKPYKIAWYVDEPIKYKVLITDKMIRQWDEDTNEVSEISMSSNSIFQNLIDQLTIWFSGQYAVMLEKYYVNIRNQNPYIIEFIPKEKSMAEKIFHSITVVFREDARYLKQIKFLEVSGDTTVITLENTLLNSPLDESLFIIEPVK